MLLRFGGAFRHKKSPDLLVSWHFPTESPPAERCEPTFLRITKVCASGLKEETTLSPLVRHSEPTV